MEYLKFLLYVSTYVKDNSKEGFSFIIVIIFWEIKGKKLAFVEGSGDFLGCSCHQLVLMCRILGAGKLSLKEVIVGMVAIFDGHNGADASDMASKLLLEYFILHTYFLLDATYSAAFKRPMARLLKSKEGDTVFQLLDWDEVLGHRELDLGRCFSLQPTYWHTGYLYPRITRI